MSKTNHRAKKVEGLIGIVGIPGKGKTYFLQKLALQYKAKGYLVVLGNCQWTLEGAIHFNTEEELLGIYLDPVTYDERLAVFVDEAQALWPSREWSKTKKDIRDWFAMFRHGGVVAFYYTTQSLGDIELMIRAKTQFIWSCGYIWGLKLFHHTMYAKAEFEKQDNGQTIKPFVYARNWFFARDLKTNYNTYACYERIKKLGQQNQQISKLLNENSARDCSHEHPRGISLIRSFCSFIKNIICIR
ncbi:zonular occludens toxin domain-containing protein [Desulfosporosinus youngiae]|uniref:Signal recognition particle GTPase n=1 Tax=Desulfosporosinus youngiae DSM 17734 TaxID=768710 RepID=H5Y2A1_9FIRM|nr:zonular occludens toxin domain-containing protein [Desulfosporosinus youngiae]EHQ88449.1 signal recognition particle GTPase [Desulfosporosinus youngiae DSM 17734]